MEYTPAENLESGKARLVTHIKLQLHEGILDDKQKSYYTPISCQMAD